MARFALALLFCLSTLPGFAAPAHEVSPLSYGPSQYDAHETLIASNGSTFVTVWRTGAIWMQDQIFASALDAAGHSVNPNAKPIISAGLPLQLLSMGENYALLWMDPSLVTHATILNPQLEVIRAFALPKAPFLRRFAASTDRLLDVSIDDQRVVAGQLLDLDGRVVLTLALSPGGTVMALLDVVADGDSFAVLFSGSAGLIVQRITGDGEVKPALTVASAAAASRNFTTPAIAANAGRLLVTWVVPNFIASPDVLRALIVDRDNHITPIQGIPVPGGAVRTVAAKKDENGFAIFAHTGIWQTAPQLALSGWKIQSTGEGFTAVPFVAAPEGNARVVTDVAVSGAASVAAAVDFVIENGYRNGGRVVALPLEPAAEPDVLSIVPRRQVTPAAASNGVDFFVAWSESMLGANALLASKIGRDGIPLRSADTDLALSQQLASSPAVAFGASIYLAVWSTGPDLMGAMVLPSGAVFDRFVVRHGIAPLEPAVIWDGQRFAVVWRDVDSIKGTFVALDGKAAEAREWSSPIPNDMESRYFSRPHIAWNGRSYLVGWSTISGGVVCTCVPPPPLNYLRLVNTDGVPSSDQMRLEGNAYDIDLASNGSDFVVVGKQIDQVTIATVHAQDNRVVAEPATPVFDWIGFIGASVAFDGRDYVVALRYGTQSDPLASWLATARFAGTGPVTDRRFSAIDQSETIETPAIAVGDSDVLVAASAVRPAVGASRVYSFLESEMDQLPAPPQPPTNVHATQTFCPGTSYPCGTRVSWSGSGDDGGYVIEGRYSGNESFSERVQAPAGAQNLTWDFAAEAVRVRALGPGGVSAPSVTTDVSDSGRRRAAHH